MIEKRLKPVHWKVCFLENESIALSLRDPLIWPSILYVKIIKNEIDKYVFRKVLTNIRPAVGTHVCIISNSIWQAPNKAWQRTR